MPEQPAPSRFLLRSLPFLVRIGLTGLLAALGIGMAASLTHLLWHYDNRDEQKGFTPDDVKANYHGLDAPAPMLAAMERGHPDTLDKESRDVLVKWLKSGRINEDFENIDLGASTPKEILAKDCASCHSPTSTDVAARAIPLVSTEDVRKVSFARKVNPTDKKLVVMSIHAHALSLGTMGVLVLGLLWFSRLPRFFVSLLVVLFGLGLPLDLAAWWLARDNAAFVPVIMIAGAAFNGGLSLGIGLVFLDLWWPRSRRG